MRVPGSPYRSVRVPADEVVLHRDGRVDVVIHYVRPFLLRGEGPYTGRWTRLGCVDTLMECPQPAGRLTGSLAKRLRDRRRRGAP